MCSQSLPALSGFPSLAVFWGPYLFRARRQPHGCTPRRQRQREEQERKEQEVEEQLMKEIPRALPDVRERALSIGSLTDADVGGIDMSDQLQSIFSARLPRELREVIYKYYFGGDEGTCRHIFRRTDNRLGYHPCTEDASRHDAIPSNWGYDGVSCTGAWVKSQAWVKSRAWAKRKDIHGGSPGPSLGLLKTCRQVYSESIHLLYSTNTLCFHDPLSFRYFSEPRHTLPHRFNSISSIQLPWITPISAPETSPNHVSDIINKEVAAGQMLGTLSRVEFPKALREIRFLIAEEESQLCTAWGFPPGVNSLEDVIEEIERWSRDRGIRILVDGEEARTVLT